MPFKHKIEISTINRFQGKEKNIILLSLTKTHSDQLYGKMTIESFFDNIQRCNVSLTRAKCLLIVIGNENMLKNNHNIWGEWWVFMKQQRLCHKDTDLTNILENVNSK